MKSSHSSLPKLCSTVSWLYAMLTVENKRECSIIQYWVCIRLIRLQQAVYYFVGEELCKLLVSLPNFLCNQGCSLKLWFLPNMNHRFCFYCTCRLHCCCIGSKRKWSMFAMMEKSGPGRNIGNFQLACWHKALKLQSSGQCGPRFRLYYSAFYVGGGSLLLFMPCVSTESIGDNRSEHVDTKSHT